MMKNINMCLQWLVAGFLVTATVFAQAADVAVIVNSSNQEAFSIQKIKNIYSDRVTTWKNGQNIKIYNLPFSQKATDIFARNVLGLSGQAAAKAESQRKTNNTLKNPSSTKRERLVVSIVSRKSNAIGYVPEHLVKNKKGIRIVQILKKQ